VHVKQGGSTHDDERQRKTSQFMRHPSGSRPREVWLWPKLPKLVVHGLLCENNLPTDIASIFLLGHGSSQLTVTL
jgi:hypothetical protein